MDIHSNSHSGHIGYARATMCLVKGTHTPHRPIRVEDDLWEEFGRLVGPRNRSAVIREFIRWYVRKSGAKLPKRPPQRDSTEES